MTEKQKTLWKRIFVGASTTVVAALIMWLGSLLYSTAQAFGSYKSIPPRVESLEHSCKKSYVGWDSLSTAFKIHKAVQVEQTNMIVNDIKEIKDNINLLIEIELKKGKK